MPDVLSKEAILDGLATRLMGQCLEVHEEIDSTNTRAVAWAQSGAPDGAVVVADHQTQGRGRLGRQWHAPSGSSLLLSLILRPPLSLWQAQRATMICSLGALEAIEEIAGLAAQIKWPNDIVLAGGKLGGVLTELGARAHELDYVVVGMGLNVNLDLAALPEALTPPASLLATLGRPLSRVALLQALLLHVERRYEALRVGWSPHTEWRMRLATLGQRVQVGTPEQVIEGRAEDVDADGALLVRTDDGELRRVLVGDVTLRGHRL
jgi:BirA family biotin operon repressor/biotin-[acetyl-CoA-carboxylase] ligase